MHILELFDNKYIYECILDYLILLDLYVLSNICKRFYYLKLSVEASLENKIKHEMSLNDEDNSIYNIINNNNCYYSGSLILQLLLNKNYNGDIDIYCNDDKCISILKQLNKIKINPIDVSNVKNSEEFLDNIKYDSTEIYYKDLKLLKGTDFNINKAIKLFDICESYNDYNGYEMISNIVDIIIYIKIQEKDVMSYYKINKIQLIASVDKFKVISNFDFDFCKNIYNKKLGLNILDLNSIVKKECTLDISQFCNISKIDIDIYLSNFCSRFIKYNSRGFIINIKNIKEYIHNLKNIININNERKHNKKFKRNKHIISIEYRIDKNIPIFDCNKYNYYCTTKGNYTDILNNLKLCNYYENGEISKLYSLNKWLYSKDLRKCNKENQISIIFNYVVTGIESSLKRNIDINYIIKNDSGLIRPDVTIKICDIEYEYIYDKNINLANSLTNIVYFVDTSINEKIIAIVIKKDIKDFIKNKKPVDRVYKLKKINKKHMIYYKRIDQSIIDNILLQRINTLKSKRLYELALKNKRQYNKNSSDEAL